MGTISYDILEEAVVLGKQEVLEDNLAAIKSYYFAHLLGTACRFGGVEQVRGLLECCKQFDTIEDDDDYQYGRDLYHCVTVYSCMLLDYCPWGDLCLPINMCEWYRCPATNEVHRTIKKSDRLKILDVLLDVRELIKFDPGLLLYYAIMCEDHDIESFLCEKGVMLSQVVCRELFSKSPGWYWGVLTRILGHRDMYFERFLDIVSRINQVSGGQLIKCSTNFLEQNYFIFRSPDIMRWALNCFDHTNINKLSIMKSCMTNHAMEYLVLFDEIGWLKRPASCDALLKYVKELQETELVAWLLDYRNRTRDLEAERMRAEKQAERELTASPDSVFMMQKRWGYKKLDDGTLQIISYKGSDSEIIVPEKIGKRKVSAIGPKAFTRYNRGKYIDKITSIVIPEGITRLCESAFEGLSALKTIVLPETLNSIGDNCFYLCKSLHTISIPGKVELLGGGVFAGCEQLESAALTEGIEFIGRFAFLSCSNLTTVAIPSSVTHLSYPIFESSTILKVHEGSVAHEYCLEHSVPFKLVT